MLRQGEEQATVLAAHLRFAGCASRQRVAGCAATSIADARGRARCGLAESVGVETWIEFSSRHAPVHSDQRRLRLVAFTTPELLAFLQPRAAKNSTFDVMP